MTDDRSSFVVSHLITGLRKVMPESDRTRLDPYEERAAAAGSDKAAEWHRAYRCAKWATRVISLPARNHVVAEAKRALEVVKQVEESIGAELADAIEVPFGYAVSPGFRVELEWVTEAVEVAGKVAAKVGWDTVPWPQLLDEVLSIG